MKALFVNCAEPEDIQAVLERLGTVDEQIQTIHVPRLKDAIGPIMEEPYDLMMVCADELTRQERNMLGYLSSTYPGLKIIIKLGKTEEKQVFINKGMMQSDPEVLKKITEA